MYNRIIHNSNIKNRSNNDSSQQNAIY